MNDAYAYRLMGNGEGEWEVSVLGAVRRGQHVRFLEPSVAIIEFLASPWAPSGLTSAIDGSQCLLRPCTTMPPDSGFLNPSIATTRLDQV